MLKKYREKRDFSKTPEPAGTRKSPTSKRRNLTFVIQEHAATRLHFDFRLEYNGILLSWAVPKGPSLNPSDKRLAVMTEDHPLDYAGFEGIIPSGYGAGEVIVWDNGTYDPLNEEEETEDNIEAAQEIIKTGLRKGKLLFQLQGKKLQGIWTLVRLKNTDNHWLLIKHKDKFASLESHPWQDDSVLSGETLEDLQSDENSPSRKKNAGKRKSATLSVSKKNSKNQKKRSRSKLPSFESPMLATLTTEPFNKEGWTFEPKLDGIRALCYLNNNEVALYSRRGQSLTLRYPSLIEELKEYNDDLVVDGEIVAFNKEGVPSFEKLQERSGLTRESDIKRAEEENPIKYYVFDILFLSGKDLRQLPFYERRQLLEKIIRPTEHVELIEELGQNGDKAFQSCIENGLEGVVGKRWSSSYQSARRSTDWLKIKSTLSDEFLICGYSQGTGGRQNTFGALILGEYNRANKLVHVGSVGTGFTEKRIKELLSIMKPLRRKECPFAECPKGITKPTWLEPKLVAEIKFAERTKDNSLRVPVFLHLREDIEPKKVKPKPVIEDPELITSQKSTTAAKKIPQAVNSRVKSGSTKTRKNNNILDCDNDEIEGILSQLDEEKENIQLEVEGNRIKLSSLDKPFWPGYGSHASVTKRDYIKYLVLISQWLLPHVRNRQLTLIRFPNGIKGPKFFQRHWHENRPSFVNTVKIFTEHENKDQDFLLCNNLSTLIWLGQIADIELHTAHTRIDPLPDGKKLPTKFTGSIENLENSLLNYPDFMVFDLDPYLYSGKEASGDEPELHRKGFRETCKAALWFKELFDQLSLQCYLKTSGRTGLHLYIPIKRNIDYDQVRKISHTICSYILAKHPGKVTTDWAVKKRTGKVFLDHNMNSRSKSLASIYSPRVSKEASVSTPLSWDELEEVYPTDFTIETLPARLQKHGDLWSDILASKNDLTKLFENFSTIAD